VSSADGSVAACTLSYGEVSATSTSWWLETEGLPSLSAGRGDILLLPCHAAPVGASLRTILYSRKTIVQLGRSGRADTSVSFAGFTGLRGTATGIRQAATVDGRSFWVAGIARNEYGVRYVASRDATDSSRVYGQVGGEGGGPASEFHLDEVA